MRKYSVNRKTKETEIEIDINLDGKGKSEINTGIGFLDHMLDQLSKHSLIDLKIKAKGDLHVDFHHTTEDSALALGEAFTKALGDKKGILRFGQALSAMDETLSRVVVDCSNRPYLIWKVNLSISQLGTIKINLKNMETNLPGVFAAGDIVRGASLVVWAIKDGRDAADSIKKYLENKILEQSKVA